MKQYIEANRDRFFDELFSLLRIPSVSSLESHRPDMQRCAVRLAELLKEAGADTADVYPTQGHPVVFGQKTIDPSFGTVHHLRQGDGHVHVVAGRQVDSL